MIDLGGDPPVPGKWYIDTDSGNRKYYCQSVKKKTVHFSDEADGPVTLHVDLLAFAIFFKPAEEVP